jgi:hypothetical protein
MSKQMDEQTKRWSIAGVGMPAGLLLGMGYGFLAGNITAGIFIGLGAGFLFMLISMVIMHMKGGG